MDLTQISKNGYRLTNVFDEIRLEQMRDLCAFFEPMEVRPGYNNESKRESFFISGPLKTQLDLHFKRTLLNLTGIIKEQVTYELWRDYGGYYNLWHKDFPNVHNVIIVYLDENMPAMVGTQYEEDGEIYSVSYKQNNAMVLLNSNQINHGMIGPVPMGMVRRTLYINWKSQ